MLYTPSYLFIPNMHVKGGDLFFFYFQQKERKQNKLKKNKCVSVLFDARQHEKSYMNMYDCNTIDTNYGEREREREVKKSGTKAKNK